MAAYHIIPPDAVILLGLRAWTSLIGISLILVGHWRFDRRWDNSGEEDDDIESPQKTGAPTNTKTVQTLVNEYMDNAYQTITNHQSADLRRIRDVFGSSSGADLTLALVGWALLMLSSLFDVDAFAGFRVTGNSLLTLLSLAVLAVVQTVILPTAITAQWVHQHNHFFLAALLGCYQVLAILVAFGIKASPIWLPITGGVSIVAGFYSYWHNRKRGNGYDRGSVVNDDAKVFHAGGPLVMVGWLMMWVAFNLVNAMPGSFLFLPVFWTSRTAVCFEGAFAIVVAYWVVNHAHDEYRDTDGHTNAFQHFTSVTDIRLSFAVSYFILAIASYLPTFAQSFFFPTLIFLTIVLVGFAVGVQQVLGLRAGDSEKLHRWSRVSLILMTVVAVLVILAHGWKAGFLVYLGTITMSLGWSRLHHDRKRGAFWLQTDTPNPHYDVFSAGAIIFPLGVLLLAWGMSVL